MTELCEEAGISRKTGYKILDRYRKEGPEGLRDRSRAPHRHPNQTSPEIEGMILRWRKARPTWGSKKILVKLAGELLAEEVPARSTVDAVLKRAGVVTPRKCRARRPKQSPPVVEATGPNEVWSIDYKGWFRVGDGTRCDPLTVNDVFSRMSLECRALVSPKLEDVQRRLEMSFVEYGLPKTMLSDNGPPFGSSGLGGLSRLGVWLLKLGVQPVFIQPGHPEQNGRHERFHETLKAETAAPPRGSIRAQQAAFGRFQQQYNEERPHEALDMQTPSELYASSSREMPASPPDFEYADSFEVRCVRRDGFIKWGGATVFVSSAAAGEFVGIETLEEDGHHRLHLGQMPLGIIHARSRTVVPKAGGTE